MASYLQANASHKPLSQRAAGELLAHAAELRSMATTARTADTRAALEALAERFSALAAARVENDPPVARKPE